MACKLDIKHEILICLQSKGLGLLIAQMGGFKL